MFILKRTYSEACTRIYRRWLVGDCIDSAERLIHTTWRAVIGPVCLCFERRLRASRGTEGTGVGTMIRKVYGLSVNDIHYHMGADNLAVIELRNIVSRTEARIIITMCDVYLLVLDCCYSLF